MADATSKRFFKPGDGRTALSLERSRRGDSNSRPLHYECDFIPANPSNFGKLTATQRSYQRSELPVSGHGSGHLSGTPSRQIRIWSYHPLRSSVLRTMTAKEQLLHRVSALTEDEAAHALKLLDMRLDPVLQALRSAPPDDEAWTEAHEAAVKNGRVQLANGDTVSLDEACATSGEPWPLAHGSTRSAEHDLRRLDTPVRAHVADALGTRARGGRAPHAGVRPSQPGRAARAHERSRVAAEK